MDCSRRSECLGKIETLLQTPDPFSRQSVSGVGQTERKKENLQAERPEETPETQQQEATERK